jgi:hypothetical protein
MAEKEKIILPPLTASLSGTEKVEILSGNTLSNLVHKKYTPLPYFDDASIYRFVSRDTPLADKSYEPDDLVSISGSMIDMAGRS